MLVGITCEIAAAAVVGVSGHVNARSAAASLGGRAIRAAPAATAAAGDTFLAVIATIVTGTAIVRIVVGCHTLDSAASLHSSAVRTCSAATTRPADTQLAGITHDWTTGIALADPVAATEVATLPILGVVALARRANADCRIVAARIGINAIVIRRIVADHILARAVTRTAAIAQCTQIGIVATATALGPKRLAAVRVVQAGQGNTIALFDSTLVVEGTALGRTAAPGDTIGGHANPVFTHFAVGAGRSAIGTIAVTGCANLVTRAVDSNTQTIDTQRVDTQFIRTANLAGAVLGVAVQIRAADLPGRALDVSTIGRDAAAVQTYFILATALAALKTIGRKTLSIRTVLAGRALDPDTVLPLALIVIADFISFTGLAAASGLKTLTARAALAGRTLDSDTVGVNAFFLVTNFREIGAFDVGAILGIAPSIGTHEALAAFYIDTRNAPADTINTNFAFAKTTGFGAVDRVANTPGTLEPGRAIDPDASPLDALLVNTHLGITGACFRVAVNRIACSGCASFAFRTRNLQASGRQALFFDTYFAQTRAVSPNAVNRIAVTPGASRALLAVNSQTGLFGTQAVQTEKTFGTITFQAIKRQTFAVDLNPIGAAHLDSPRRASGKKAGKQPAQCYNNNQFVQTRHIPPPSY